jgi:Mn-containing catalase
VNGELKNAVERSSLPRVMNGAAGRDDLVHEALTSPAFLVLSGGGPVVTDSNGYPWNGNYVNANGDLTVDLRSNIGAESRAKIVYEYLMQFTDDKYIHETLGFLMTREIAHFQMFSAALADIQPNFPPGVLQGNPKFTHTYFNMSADEGFRAGWNQGQGPWRDGEHWAYIADPAEHVHRTKGLREQGIEGSTDTPSTVARRDETLSRQRSAEVKSGMPPAGPISWSSYSDMGGGLFSGMKSASTPSAKDKTKTPTR